MRKTKTTTSEKKSVYVTANGSTSKVLEVYESYSGWYWFITDKPNEVEWFGLVKGFETEWGYIYTPELLGTKGIWKVPRENWTGVPLLHTK